MTLNIRHEYMPHVVGNLLNDFGDVFDNTLTGIDEMALENLAESVTGNVEDYVAELEDLGNGGLADVAEESEAAKVPLALLNRGSPGGRGHDGHARGETSDDDRSTHVNL